MSIAEKLITVAENVPKVYEAGEANERQKHLTNVSLIDLKNIGALSVVTDDPMHDIADNYISSSQITVSIALQGYVDFNGAADGYETRISVDGNEIFHRTHVDGDGGYFSFAGNVNSEITIYQDLGTVTFDKFVANKDYIDGVTKEYNDFWDIMQNYGAKSNYGYAFSGALWTDDIFKPKYDIICTSGINMFRLASITDSKVSIDVSGVNGTYMFFECTTLKTVRKIIVNEKNVFTGFLQSCSKLEEIRFEGIIGKSLDVHWSTKLSGESIDNIFNSLGGTADATLTLPTTARDNYDAVYGGGAYYEKIFSLPGNWNVLTM